MPLDAAGIGLKLDRAAHHLDALEESLDSFMSPDPKERRGIAIEIDSEHRNWQIVVHLPGGIPAIWSVLIGEVLYQLRSSLDHIVNGLVAVSTPDNAFPICLQPKDYRSNKNRLLAGVPEADRATIYELQPFRQDEEHPDNTTIWALHELSRLDRHRFLHVTGLYLTGCPITFDPVGSGVTDLSIEMPCRIEHDLVIARGHFGDATTASESKVNAFAIGDMVLPDLKAVRIEDASEVAYLAVEGLKYMLIHVRDDIVPRFV